MLLSQRFAAWVAAAITALSINLQAVNAPVQDLTSFISDPFNVVYTHAEEDLNDYLDKNVIQILPNGTVIDGEYYDDVWLSHDAADIFRTNAFDFQTAYNIASNTNGTFASGVGYNTGLAFFDVSGVSRSQSFSLPASVGIYPLSDSLSIEQFLVDDTHMGISLIVDGVSHSTGANRILLRNFPMTYHFEYVPSSSAVYGFYTNQSGVTSRLNYSLGSLSDEPFDFDYISGTIPVDPLPNDDGLLIHVPHAPDGTSHFSSFISDNPDFDNGAPVTIDMDTDPDIEGQLGDIIAIIAPLIPDLIAEYAPQQVVPPVPSQETIADTQYSELDNTLQNIIQSIQSIPSAISSLGDTILKDIQEGPIRLFDKFLDIFRTIFAPVINLITAGLGIWHYVLEWLSAISAPFTFILSVVPSGVMVPIYSAVAGALVIAIWRRFGK